MHRSPLVLFGAAALTAACQVYDFEPQLPGAVSSLTERRVVVVQEPAPNLMLVVDRSGSMDEPVDREHPACAPGCSNLDPCGPGCPTRLSELRAAIDVFVTEVGDEARLGLAVFPPQQELCGAGGVELAFPQTDDRVELAAHAAVLRAQVDALTSHGGTPTAQTLRAVAAHPAMVPQPGRPTTVILLTDGLPNCNPALDSQRCTCTHPDVSPCSPSLNCLDEDGAVQALEELQRSGISTAIVAFGMDGSDDTVRRTLGAMAKAGSFPRGCFADGDCPSGARCEQFQCTERFFLAGDARELAVALTAVFRFISINPCELTLDARPEDDRFVAVYVDQQRVATGPDTWKLEVGSPYSTIHLLGGVCERVLSSTVDKPVELEVRLIERL
jgi:hypothetical protein